MFSGIIADTGVIARVEDRDGGLRIAVSAGTLDLGDVQIGDSIGVNGVCLTVVKKENNSFTVEVSRETLDCTVGLDVQGAPVNLEKALRMADRLSGHLVSGHVDGVGEVVEFTDLVESWELIVRAPSELGKFIATKGSITINGVSLTVNEISGNEFSVNLIPHTVAETNLKYLGAGSRVNLEVDLIARYVDRMMQDMQEQSQ